MKVSKLTAGRTAGRPGSPCPLATGPNSHTAYATLWSKDRESARVHPGMHRFMSTNDADRATLWGSDIEANAPLEDDRLTPTYSLALHELLSRYFDQPRTNLGRRRPLASSPSHARRPSGPSYHAASHVTHARHRPSGPKATSGTLRLRTSPPPLEAAGAPPTCPLSLCWLSTSAS